MKAGSLCLTFEHGLPAEQATAAMQQAAKRKAAFRWLEPPSDRGRITTADVHRAGSAKGYAEIVGAWAEGVWAAWAAHHGTIHTWAASR